MTAECGGEPDDWDAMRYARRDKKWIRILDVSIEMG